jgi:diketogulonate reductase-like aldo/keto reductase
MPSLGLGTFPMKRKLLKTIPLAYSTGYRAFDTASAYGNESYLGWAFKLFPRSSFFITSKLSNSGQRSGDVRAELKATLSRLKLQYLDLYLMHWPNPETYLECWTQMEILYKEGLVRAIGLCNFHEHHLDQLLKVASVVPAINQIELHPLLTQQPLVNYCKSKGIAVEAYSPLARMDPKLIENHVLRELGDKHQKTVPQIVLRWIVQSGYLTCPKTSSYMRLRQNMGIFDFELSDDQMNRVAVLNENYRVRHNPDTADFRKL